MIDPWIYPALTATAVLTGFIDAIAGGGGLIMLPALLFAGVSPIQALATNKLQSVFGTSVATRNYARAGLVNWHEHKTTILLVFGGATLGVLLVQSIQTRLLDLSNDLGARHRERLVDCRSAASGNVGLD